MLINNVIKNMTMSTARTQKQLEPLVFTMGVDLGQTNDFTALSVLSSREDIPDFSLPSLKRLQRGRPYPEQVQVVIERYERLKAMTSLPDEIKIVVDRTGVGRAVFDLFVLAELPVVGITITGGNQVIAEQDGTGFRVPKRDLVGCVKVLLQQNALKISGQLAEAKILQSEMQNFTYKINDNANDIYGRENQHDDLLLSVACASWYAARGRGYALPGEYRVLNLLEDDDNEDEN
jgi:hypothetical protein